MAGADLLGRDLIERRELDRDIRQLGADEGEVGQRLVAHLAAQQGHQIVLIEKGLETGGGKRKVTRREIQPVPRLIERTRRRQDAAIHHDEGFGRRLHDTIGIRVGEGEQPPGQKRVPEVALLVLEALSLERGQVGDVFFSAEQQVHEAQVVVERQPFRAVQDRLPKRQIAGDRGRRALQRHADIPGNVLHFGRCHPFAADHVVRAAAQPGSPSEPPGGCRMIDEGADELLRRRTVLPAGSRSRGVGISRGAGQDSAGTGCEARTHVLVQIVGPAQLEAKRTALFHRGRVEIDRRAVRIVELDAEAHRDLAVDLRLAIVRDLECFLVILSEAFRHGPVVAHGKLLLDMSVRVGQLRRALGRRFLSATAGTRSTGVGQDPDSRLDKPALGSGPVVNIDIDCAKFLIRSGFHVISSMDRHTFLASQPRCARDLCWSRRNDACR